MNVNMTVAYRKMPGNLITGSTDLKDNIISDWKLMQRLYTGRSKHNSLFFVFFLVFIFFFRSSIEKHGVPVI